MDHPQVRRAPAARTAVRHAPSAPSQGPESLLDSRLIEQTLGDSEHLSRWMGWRLKLLVVAALVGVLGCMMLANWLANSPQIRAEWRANTSGKLMLASSAEPQLIPHLGKALVSINSSRHDAVTPDPLALATSTRWIIDDEDRRRQQQMHEQVNAVLTAPVVRLSFSDGAEVSVAPMERGLASLGAVFWLVLTLSFVLYLVGMVVVLAKPSLRTLLYSLMCLSQTGTLVFIAVESTRLLAVPGGFSSWNLPLRMAFDLTVAAAVVHAATVHPLRAPHQPLIGAAVWGGMVLFGTLIYQGVIGEGWWALQVMVATMGGLTVYLQSRAYGKLSHPFALVMRRFGLMAVSTWVLLTFAVALASSDEIPSYQQQIASIGPSIWYIFLASLLLLMPFLSKSQQLMREFSLLAAISTVATSLDLLFVAVFSFGQFESLTLALFLSLGLYAGTRQWLLTRMLSRNLLTTERMFEKLYRIARAVEVQPDRAAELMLELMRELFEPLDAVIVRKRSPAVRVVSDGSTLMMPVPTLTDKQAETPASIVLRFANRGQRLFTSDDARLTDRIVEQLCRAVAFDRAVEQGRSEERLRLAQDLHDDIGARLLTLMYKAQSPEMEDYVRHTLQDLKTLTRGLAAPDHPLSHAAGEWKLDLTQRLSAAQMKLVWNLQFDRDQSLSVVQWSGLTRVMRELVSNAIAHAQASRLAIDFHLERDRLELTITDNGTGRDPKAWSHGLGLGGVRKRVKQLGGEVAWSEMAPQGIRCRVIIPRLSERL